MQHNLILDLEYLRNEMVGTESIMSYSNLLVTRPSRGNI